MSCCVSMGPWMGTWLQGLIWRLNKRISRDRATIILISCLRQVNIFHRETHVTRILITCLRQGKIFCRGSCVTGILITCIWRGKNFFWGNLKFSTRREYFLNYNIVIQPLFLVWANLIIQLCFHKKENFPLLLISNIVKPTDIYFWVPFPTL